MEGADKSTELWRHAPRHIYGLKVQIVHWENTVKANVIGEKDEIP